MSLEDTAGATPIGNVTVEPNTGTESDHFLVTFQVPFTWKPKNSSACLKEVEMRDLKKIDVSKFREDVFTSPLNLSDFRSLDLDSAVQLYNDVLQTILDKHAPVVLRTFKVKKSDFFLLLLKLLFKPITTFYLTNKSERKIYIKLNKLIMLKVNRCK